VRTILTVTVLLGATLSAHALSVSYAQVSVQDRRIAAIVRLPIDDVDLLLRLDTDLDGQISSAELEAAKPRLQAYVTKHLRVRADDANLSIEIGRLSLWRDPAKRQYLEAECAAAAPRTIEAVSVHSDFLVELYPAHKTLGEMQIAGRREQFVFDAQHAYTGRAAAGSASATLFSFLGLGIEHIFTGYDHILFLFGLLLVGTGLRNLVAVVTSFTVAHSASLALATFGVVSPVPWMFVAAIALSIEYIGIVNVFLTLL